ncbi:MAG: helix-turn-helix domain-containing protein [Bryobacteraceae bacterium]
MGASIRPVSAEILKVIQPIAIDAACQAADQLVQKRSEGTRAVELELEQARYEARLAARRYEAIDPENRLVASELESRWNVALCRVRELESRAEESRQEPTEAPAVNRDELLRLAEDLPAVWDSPLSDSGLKQRITRILIREIVADVDEQAQEIVLVIHWVGGRHAELRVAKSKSGHHSRCTKAEAVDIVRQMALTYTGEEIALTLNRLRLKTGAGNTWNETRVRSLRGYLKVPTCPIGPQRDNQLNMEQAAERLGVSATVVRRLIERKAFPATQVVPGAPWQIDAKDVASPEVIRVATALKNRESRLRHHLKDDRTLQLPSLYDESTEDEITMI